MSVTVMGMNRMPLTRALCLLVLLGCMVPSGAHSQESEGVVAEAPAEVAQESEAEVAPEATPDEPPVEVPIVEEEPPVELPVVEGVPQETEATTTEEYVPEVGTEEVLEDVPSVVTDEMVSDVPMVPTATTTDATTTEALVTSVGNELWSVETSRFFELNTPVVLIFPYTAPQTLLEAVGSFLQDTWQTVVVDPLTSLVEVATGTLDMIADVFMNDTQVAHEEVPQDAEVLVPQVPVSVVMVDGMVLDPSFVMMEEGAVSVIVPESLAHPATHTLAMRIVHEGEEYVLENFDFLVGGTIAQQTEDGEGRAAYIVVHPTRGPEVWLAGEVSTTSYEYVASVSGLSDDAPFMFKEGNLLWAEGDGDQSALAAYSLIGKTLFSQSLEERPEEPVALPSGEYLIERERDEFVFELLEE